MSKARLIITAVIVQGRSQHEVARACGISQSWVSRLVARYHAEGEAAFQPRSRRPKTSPTAIPPATITLVTELRDKLTSAGLDAGPDTIAWHLAHHHSIRVWAATISRYLTRLGLVTPQPTKRPKASYQRFQAELPNQCWQADFTHYPLASVGDAPARDAEVLTWLDDHSRYALDVTAHQPVTGPIVRDRFLAAVARFGTPASTLTDNAMVFTTRLPAAAAAATPWRPSCAAATSSSGTAARTSPPPAARSSGSNRPSSSGCAPNPTSPPTWPSSSSCWTSS
jgi:transposase InsO family protein